MLEIRKIDAAHAGDARLPNQPFALWGRMIPAFDGAAWSYTVEPLPQPGTDCFPDEPYDLAREDAVFLGAYDGGVCVGLAVLRREMLRYLYLDDLKVNRDRRGQGVGGRLLEACMAEAAAQGLQGVYTVGQDNNLSACLFYLRHGFAIGGFNNRAYRGTSQAHKADIYFYRDCEGI